MFYAFTFRGLTFTSQYTVLYIYMYSNFAIKARQVDLKTTYTSMKRNFIVYIYLIVLEKRFGWRFLLQHAANSIFVEKTSEQGSNFTETIPVEFGDVETLSPKYHTAGAL